MWGVVGCGGFGVVWEGRQVVEFGVVCEVWERVVLCGIYMR